MPKLYSNILETIGNTPIVHFEGNIWVKLEYFNPGGSLKDRIARAMLKRAEARGEIDGDTVIIEPASGNMGISLAFCAAAMGLKFIAVVPEGTSAERIKLMKAYGAEIVLTSKELGAQGATDRATEIFKELERNGQKAFAVQQFQNADNPEAHYEKTAMEIWEATEGKADVLVAGIGTGGTISGVGKRLKAMKDWFYTVGVEAAQSPLLTKGFAGHHKIQGISANFVPKTLNKKYVDEIVDISSDEASSTAREAAKKGIMVGISSGAVLKAARDAAKRHPDKFIVAILADNGERYLNGELYDEK
jgi:cysteine synthase A